RSGATENDLRVIGRPGGLRTLGFAEAHLVGSVRMDHVDLVIPGQIAVKSDSCPIRRPGWIFIRYAVFCDSNLVRAVGLHHVNLEARTIAIAGKSDARSIR